MTFTVLTAALSLTAIMTATVPAHGQEGTSPDGTAPIACPAKVFVIGDSLTDATRGGSAKYIPAAFAHLNTQVNVYARNGLSTRSALQERYRYGFGSRNAKQADAWIVALGTNDQARYGFASHLRQVMGLATKHGATVWWVNTSRPRSWQEGPGGPINRILASAAKRHHNLNIINYRRHVKTKPGLLAGDRVHMTSRGSKWRAHLYATPFTGCASIQEAPTEVRSI